MYPIGARGVLINCHQQSTPKGPATISKVPVRSAVAVDEWVAVDDSDRADILADGACGLSGSRGDGGVGGNKAVACT
jgi:hypothetical protein